MLDRRPKPLFWRLILCWELGALNGAKGNKAPVQKTLCTLAGQWFVLHCIKSKQTTAWNIECSKNTCYPIYFAWIGWPANVEKSRPWSGVGSFCSADVASICLAHLMCFKLFLFNFCYELINNICSRMWFQTFLLADMQSEKYCYKLNSLSLVTATNRSFIRGLWCFCMLCKFPEGSVSSGVEIGVCACVMTEPLLWTSTTDHISPVLKWML